MDIHVFTVCQSNKKLNSRLAFHDQLVQTSPDSRKTRRFQTSKERLESTPMKSATSKKPGKPGWLTKKSQRNPFFRTKMWAFATSAYKQWLRRLNPHSSACIECKREVHLKCTNISYHMPEERFSILCHSRLFSVTFLPFAFLGFLDD